jgi:ketosteroid isomerase-like protein
MTNKEIVLAFVKAINDHDVNKIYNLMSDDHIFIDGSGAKHTGKIDMKKNWQDYYQMFPDYNIQIADIVEDISIIGLFGFASASYMSITDKTDNFWKTTASWKAIIENKKIKLWQVYCDYTQLMEIIKKTNLIN